jgi:hypothetical protein
MGLRLSGSIRTGPFRPRVSTPLTGRGRTWVSGGTRVGRRGWLGVSAPVGGRKRRPR